VGQSPMPETEKKEGNPLENLPKIPKKEIPVVKISQDDTKFSTSRHDTDVTSQDILEEAAEVPSGTSGSKSSTVLVNGDDVDLSQSSRLAYKKSDKTSKIYRVPTTTSSTYYVLVVGRLREKTVPGSDRKI